MANDNLDEAGRSLSMDAAAADNAAANGVNGPGSNNDNDLEQARNETSRTLLYSRYCLDSSDDDSENSASDDDNDREKKICETNQAMLYRRSFCLDGSSDKAEDVEGQLERETKKETNRETLYNRYCLDGSTDDESQKNPDKRETKAKKSKDSAHSEGTRDEAAAATIATRLEDVYSDWYTDQAHKRGENKNKEQTTSNAHWTSSLGGLQKPQHMEQTTSNAHWTSSLGGLEKPQHIPRGSTAQGVKNAFGERGPPPPQIPPDTHHQNRMFDGVAPFPSSSPSIEEGDRHYSFAAGGPPGAHWVNRSLPNDNDPSLLEGSSIGGEPSEETSIAVANLVPDEEQPSQHLPQAIPRDTMTNAHWLKHRWQAISLLLFLGIVTVIFLSLAFTFAPDTEEDDYDSYHLQITAEPTTSPSSAPTSFLANMLSMLPDPTIQSIEQDPESPQAKAFEWLVEDTNTNPSLDDWRLLQRYSLATLYYATGGEHWLQNDHWMRHNVSECNWHSSVQAKIFPPNLPTCNANEGLENLGLTRNNLVNTLPPELFLLTSLKTLALGLNRLQGTIPTRVGQLTNLQGLWIFKLQNGGQIPTQVGLLTNLKTLSFANNQHTGTLPTQLGKLTNMISLFLGRNPQVTGTIPDVTDMSKLKWFNVDKNSHTGTISAEMAKLTNLEWFQLGSNKLQGTIPSQIGTMSNLNFVSLYENQLQGTLPTELGLLTHTTMMTFNANQITGTIPSELGNLVNLTLKLALQENPGLTGPIPTQFGRFSSLRILSLARNSLTGPVPSELGVLSSLGKLEMGNNSLTGTIPAALAPLQQSLYHLDIQGNALLSGTVPQAICNINGTCTPHRFTFLLPCPKSRHFAFTCSEALCGCGCSCNSGAGSNGTVLKIIQDVP